MTKRVAAAITLAIALALAVPPAARAAPSAYLGGRIGLAFPYGSAVEVGGTTTSQRALAKTVVPLQLDGGARLGPVELGGYLSYGFASVGSACPGSCSGRELRVGVQANLRSPLARERELWAGALLGYERLELSPRAGGDSLATGWQGGLQAGYDLAASSFGFGPFGMVTFGEYGKFERGGARVSGFGRKLHGELQVGVRGFFRL